MVRLYNIHHDVNCFFLMILYREFDELKSKNKELPNKIRAVCACGPLHVTQNRDIHKQYTMYLRIILCAKFSWAHFWDLYHRLRL